VLCAVGAEGCALCAWGAEGRTLYAALLLETVEAVLEVLRGVCSVLLCIPEAVEGVG
jgi:hypothetical protein